MNIFSEYLHYEVQENKLQQTWLELLQQGQQSSQFYFSKGEHFSLS